MDYAEFCDYLLYIGEARLQERDNAILRLKGLQPPQTMQTRSCDMLCDVLKILSESTIKRQQSQTPLLHQYIPESVMSLVVSTPAESKGEQYCSDLAMVAYRSYELAKIENVLKELFRTEALGDLTSSKQKFSDFLKRLYNGITVRGVL